MSQPDTLDRIPRGARVRVVEVDSLEFDARVSPGFAASGAPKPVAGSPQNSGAAIARRLDDLGIRSGVVLEVIRRAPLGDPTVFELHGYQLCLRKSESSRVRVEAVQPS